MYSMAPCVKDPSGTEHLMGDGLTTLGEVLVDDLVRALAFYLGNDAYIVWERV